MSDFNISDYSKISDQNVDFMLNETLVYLNHTRNAKYRVEKKAIAILVFIFSFFALTYGDMKEFITGTNFSFYGGSLFISNIVCILIAYQIIKTCFFPKDIAVSGQEPRNMLNDNFSFQEFKYMKIGTIEGYQDAIDFNNALNDTITKLIKRHLFWLVINFSTFIISNIIFSFLEYFHFLHLLHIQL